MSGVLVYSRAPQTGRVPLIMAYSASGNTAVNRFGSTSRGEYGNLNLNGPDSGVITGIVMGRVPTTSSQTVYRLRVTQGRPRPVRGRTALPALMPRQGASRLGGAELDPEL